MIVTAMTWLDARRGASNCHCYPTFGFCQDTLGTSSAGSGAPRIGYDQCPAWRRVWLPALCRPGWQRCHCWGAGRGVLTAGGLGGVEWPRARAVDADAGECRPLVDVCGKGSARGGGGFQWVEAVAYLIVRPLRSASAAVSALLKAPARTLHCPTRRDLRCSNVASLPPKHVMD